MSNLSKIWILIALFIIYILIVALEHNFEKKQEELMLKYIRKLGGENINIKLLNLFDRHRLEYIYSVDFLDSHGTSHLIVCKFSRFSTRPRWEKSPASILGRN